MASRSAYYPGFLAALFLVLLRISIGWHFLYEGLWKYGQYEKPFSAEGYFRASAGPFATYFRSLIPDENGLTALHRDSEGLPDQLKAAWANDLDRYASYYNFDADQRAKAQEALDQARATADAWFRDLPNANRVRKYEDEVRKIESLERDPAARATQREWVAKERKRLNKDRTELLGTLDGWTEDLRKTWSGLAKPEQVAAAGKPALPVPLPRYDFRKTVEGRPAEPMTTLDWINTATIYGLILAGAGLILGLFTRLSAIGCALFLAMIYFSLPPWPGMPENPLSEGHYLYVSKNLIELFACLAIAALPTHHWVGLDALLFGRRRRRRLAERLEREEELAMAS